MNKDNILQQLQNENSLLKIEIKRLHNILDAAGIPYDEQEENKVAVSDENSKKSSDMEQNINLNQTQFITQKLSEEERTQIIDYRLELFMKLFQGRVDVYARRFVSIKTGISGYAPVCGNFWSYKLCPKANYQKIKCYQCENHK